MAEIVKWKRSDTQVNTVCHTHEKLEVQIMKEMKIKLYTESSIQ